MASGGRPCRRIEGRAWVPGPYSCSVISATYQLHCYICFVKYCAHEGWWRLEQTPEPPMSAVPRPAPAAAVAHGADAAPGLLDAHALAFLADLHQRFEARRQALLAARRERQDRFDGGELPDFRADTRWIREGDWRVAPLPAALLDRRVEITGPVDPKMVINALNSGASCYMADFEDSTAPTWEALLTGQRALREAVAGTLAFDADSGKSYRMKPEAERAVLIVRPRGWHLTEKHLLVDGERISASLFDAGL